jgi:hypothetical protein
MWTRNADTGKWIIQEDSLSKDYYDNYKQDLEKVRLYSKCLSGSTYLAIDKLTNIYNILQQNKSGFYINATNSIINRQTLGDNISLNESNSDEFYNKYLKEDAFTIKNFFTPTKLIDDQLQNFLLVDLSTTSPILDINNIEVNAIFDGVKLVDGHRLLVKDQISKITLSSNIDPEVYFSTINLVSNYYELENNITSITYYYYNNENGIYVYTNGRLLKTSDLETYDNSHKYSVSVKLGIDNREKQYHLSRLKNGYYPIDIQNMEFIENHNWVLRNRVDYNNIYDLNYYDILSHGTQSVYDIIDGRTYSIPERTISIGEFGVILNNQNVLSSGASFSNSTIITNKYKTNLRSICEVDNFYWICGDEGTLLKVSKIDFSITRIELNENSNLMSVSFFGNLNGMIVGKFNTIYWTKDGGYIWNKISYPEFNLYSYNKVIQYNLYQCYIGGESGIFLELNYTGGNWIFYKRKISKELNKLDEYILVEDINDMYKTNWTKLDVSTFSNDQSMIDFSENLLFTTELSNNYNILQLSIDSKYFTYSNFIGSEYYLSFSASNSIGSVYINYEYNNTISSTPINPTIYDIYSDGNISVKNAFTFSLPIDENGNLINDTYIIDVNVNYNYDALSDSIGGYTSNYLSYNIKTESGRILLIGGNNNIIVCYDIDSIITPLNQFIYYGFTQSISDVKTISRKRNGNDIFIGADSLYKFNMSDFYNIGNTNSNVSNTQLTPIVDLYSNKLYSTVDKLYMVGNNSLVKYNSYTSSTFYDLDPTFGNNIKSKMVFLDYDIASKLNFFDDNQQYRLCDSVTFSISSGIYSTFSIKNLSNEYNWLNYYKDSEKTFKYYSSINDSNAVEFSTTFSYVTASNTFTFNKNDVSINVNDMIAIAPTINSSTFSKFISSAASISNTFTTPYNVLLNKYLIIFKRNNNDITSIGDVLHFKSDIIECTLVVNKISYYIGVANGAHTLTSWPVAIPSGYTVDKYIYCYTNFNQNIINNLKTSNSVVTIINMNKYKTMEDLSYNFEKHPISIGYKLNYDSDILNISQRFNNKTAYYNMQSEVSFGPIVKNMTYKESFLNFGYSPTYNISDYLYKIDSSVFTPNKKFSILPEYVNIAGNDGNSLTYSSIYIDPSAGVQSNGTHSWYKNGTNKIIFGKNLKFLWTSLLINTFIDLRLTSSTDGSLLIERLLITKKYYDEDLDSYVMEFHKKIDVPSNFEVILFDLLSRNTLLQISDDLQILNNIQRTSVNKSIQYLNTFNSLQNELKYKFNTDSYFKALVCDNNIKKYITSIIYTDSENQLVMNTLNLDREIKYNIIGTQEESINGFNNKLRIDIDGNHELSSGDLIYVTFNGGTSSSEELNPNYFGLQTVIYSHSGYNSTYSTYDNYVITSIDYGNITSIQDIGEITFYKKDAFFNYQPIDLFNLGIDHNVTRSVEIKPENFDIIDDEYNLINLDLSKYKMTFVDGLSLEEVINKFPWILEAEISNAIIGRDENGPIWYSGTWKCGRWFGGTWISGDWISGDWYKGTWKSHNIKNKIISVKVDESYVDNNASKWFNGRWFEGTWNGGTWYNGRRYAGDWKQGNWYNGIWNDGHWTTGTFEGGVWVQGQWDSGIFNCNAKPSYWLYGSFKSGDFENGIWYNGLFGNDQNILSRFGTKSTNSRTSTWHSGKWTSGEFHSYLNINSQTGKPDVSDIHKYSIWRTGTWLKGDFYGGISYNIDFRSGIWHGGILEEIQIIDVYPLLPATYSTNSIGVNGIFKFNIGDEIWVIDDYTDDEYSPLGSNDRPMKYRINKVIEDTDSEKTYLYLNYNLSTLGVGATISSLTYSNCETGLRVVSHFKDSNWESGIWTNGIFEGGQFDSGIWYNGIFNGTWGN